MNKLDRLLAKHTCLITDGGMGSSLYDAGLRIGDAPELWLTQHPDRVSRIHQAFVAAGADIILTNTFGANRYRLALSGAQARVVELNQRGAALARATAETAGRDVIVAGAVGPLAAQVDEAEAIEALVAQMDALKAGGVDVIWIETMMTLGEIHAAQVAAAMSGLPYVVTASFDGHGQMLDGTKADDVARQLAALSLPPVALGCNCGEGPRAAINAVAMMRAAVPEAVLVAKANAGLPSIVDGRAVYDISDAAIEDYARNSRDAGARIIGGCCGMTPAHIAILRGALANTQTA
jgi:methionine synthase I (cobalamin-dependent)